MRLLVLAAVALAALAAGVGPAAAQEDDSFHIPFFDFLFGRREQPPPPQYMPRTRAAPRVQRLPRRSGPARAHVAHAPRHVVKPTTFVVVLGDAYANDLAGGLSDALADHPGVGIVLDVDPEKGLLDKDAGWQQMGREVHTGGDKVAAVVVMLGPRADRRGGRAAEPAPRSDDDEAGAALPGPSPWVDLYAARADQLMLSLRQGGTPVIWVGLPPVKDAAAAADNAALNRLMRRHVAALGGIFIDPWDSFTDSDGNYVVRGPDVDGRVVRLRRADGVHFTAAGARKLAQLVAADLRPLLAAPAGDAGAAAAALVAAQPHLPGTSRIILLNAPPRSPGATLLPAAAPAPASDADLALAHRALVEGLPVPSDPGRADDWTWPSDGK
jgi:hypothetical protein